MSDIPVPAGETSVCPVCGQELHGPDADVASHVNQHLDRDEEKESEALALALQNGLHGAHQMNNASTSTNPPENALVEREAHAEELPPAERMMRELELSDEAYAKTLFLEERQDNVRLGASVSESAELYFPDIVQKISWMFSFCDDMAVPFSPKLRQHLCSHMDMFCSNLAGIGWDCGYRNIQMLLSALLFNEQYGAMLALSGVKEVPSLPEIAERIEQIWAKGEGHQPLATPGGGLTETKVWIGATEALELMKSLDITVHIRDFETPTDEDRAMMFEWIYEQYEQWCSRQNCSVHRKKHRQVVGKKTLLEGLIPPMYCQWQGHSITIIGASKSWTGNVSLIVIDPSRGFYETVMRQRNRECSHLFRRDMSHPQMQHPRFQIVYVPPVGGVFSISSKTSNYRGGPSMPSFSRLFPFSSRQPPSPSERAPFARHGGNPDQSRTQEAEESESRSSRLMNRIRRPSEVTAERNQRLSRVGRR